jgi:outer membrane protein OmpA-like peptidoglycan-associated protein
MQIRTEADPRSAWEAQGERASRQWISPARPALIALHRILATPEPQLAALAVLLGKAGKRSVRLNGSDVPLPSYLRLLSRLFREAAENTEAHAGPGITAEETGTASESSVPAFEGPLELPVARETRHATKAATPARGSYSSWSDADDRAKARNPRDQITGGRPVPPVLIYAPAAGRNERIFVLQDFKIDGAALRPGHRAYLADVVKWMAGGGKWRIVAEAHASRTGTRRHDDLLSEDRYLVTRAYVETELQRRGVDLSRVRIVGEGVGFRHTPLPGEDPRARSVYLVVQPDPSPNPPQPWPPNTIPVSWLLTVDDFIEAVEDAQTANASDTPEQFLTRLRQLYYPGTDPEGLTVREAAFDRLLPNAPFLLPNGTRRILTPKGMDRTLFLRLAQHAPENPTPGHPLDNPSPYLVDATGSRIDIGHLLLTMDALGHPEAADPYRTFSVPAIDPASWVADLGIAAVWAEQDGVPEAPRVLPRRPNGQADLDGYYKMSAPDADLLGDLDGFNVWNLWIGSGGSLASVLVAYYYDASVVPTGRGGYRRRFREFLGNQIGHLPQDPGQLAATNSVWHKRINRFDDLFAAGTISALLTFNAPPRRQWQFTPDVFARFLKWLEDGARAEARRFP